MSMKLRPEIVAFAEAMERAMRAKDKERGEAWKGMPEDFYFKRLCEEIEEMMEAYKTYGLGHIFECETVDVANFLMMLYWRSKQRCR